MNIQPKHQFGLLCDKSVGRFQCQEKVLNFIVLIFPVSVFPFVFGELQRLLLCVGMLCQRVLHVCL